MTAAFGDRSLPLAYDWNVVAISIAIAVLAAYVALSLAERITVSRGHAKYLWLAGGATAMGSGIWAMHFAAMLALRMPITVMYDIPVVGVSLAAAVVASAIALFVVTRAEMNRNAWLVGGALMGSAIAAMHYLGMASMRMCAAARWNVPVVALSVAVAIAVSLVALNLVFRLRSASAAGGAWRRIGAACIMGMAVAGMHYTGMAAASFIAAPAFLPHGLLVGQSEIDGNLVFVSVIVLFTLVSTACFADRYVADQQRVITQQERYLRTIMSTAPVVLIALDAAGTVTVAEGRGLSTLIADAQLMVGRRFCDIFADKPALVDQARRALAGESHATDTFINDVVLDTRWTVVHDEYGALSGAIAVATDITARREAEREMRHRALTDPLTDLPNRSAMHERLEQMLDAAREWKTVFALAIIDLDRFKEVNDTLGHAIGDELLANVARHVAKALGDMGFFDCVFRIGGDEFALFLPGCNAERAVEIAQALLRELALPHDAAGYTLDVHASIGLAVFPDQAVDEQTLLRCADVAMYVAKHAGLGFAIYDTAHDRHSKTLLALEADMRRAIQEGGFELHYQPQMDMATGGVTAAEALVRWHHPVLGMLPPDRFIPIAEETGLIVPLTAWVIDEALRQIVLWTGAGHRLTIAVNVSMRSLREVGFSEAVAAALRRHGVPPEQLVIEVTETIIMIDDERTRGAFERLAELGIEISIDDFGTGYSSLAYLKRLPVDELKIDKSFIVGIADADSKDAELVRLITDLGHNLNLRVVAEGVENQDVLDILAALGCDVAQGYFISRPMPAAAFERWLNTMKTSALSGAA